MRLGTPITAPRRGGAIGCATAPSAHRSTNDQELTESGRTPAPAPAPAPASAPWAAAVLAPTPNGRGKLSCSRQWVGVAGRLRDTAEDAEHRPTASAGRWRLVLQPAPRLGSPSACWRAAPGECTLLSWPAPRGSPRVGSAVSAVAVAAGVAMGEPPPVPSSASSATAPATGEVGASSVDGARALAPEAKGSPSTLCAAVASPLPLLHDASSSASSSASSRSMASRGAAGRCAHAGAAGPPARWAVEPLRSSAAVRGPRASAVAPCAAGGAGMAPPATSATNLWSMRVAAACASSAVLAARGMAALADASAVASTACSCSQLPPRASPASSCDRSASTTSELSAAREAGVMLARARCSLVAATDSHAPAAVCSARSCWRSSRSASWMSAHAALPAALRVVLSGRCSSET
mmetsp:Transcript_26233/g.67792  ORF Transcript_26233/g.67792 Transcript_26233/m.67792 type:complete len:409 (+) Transcript_26233:707-1933(+)